MLENMENPRKSINCWKIQKMLDILESAIKSRNWRELLDNLEGSRICLDIYKMLEIRKMIRFQKIV